MADSTLHEDPDLINRKWRWRRRIAITALFALLLFPLIMLAMVVAGVDALKDYMSMFNTLLMVLGSIVGAYMGLSTWYEKR